MIYSLFLYSNYQLFLNINCKKKKMFKTRLNVSWQLKLLPLFIYSILKQICFKLQDIFTTIFCADPHTQGLSATYFNNVILLNKHKLISICLGFLKYLKKTFALLSSSLFLSYTSEEQLPVLSLSLTMTPVLPNTFP